MVRLMSNNQKKKPSETIQIAMTGVYMVFGILLGTGLVAGFYFTVYWMLESYKAGAF